MRAKDEMMQIHNWLHQHESMCKTHIYFKQIQRDTWASCGGLSANGRFVISGGYDDGQRAVRYFGKCGNDGHLEEFPSAL